MTKRYLRILLLLTAACLLTLSLLPRPEAAQSQSTAAEVLQSALKALEKANAIECEVRVETDSRTESNLPKLRATILATRSPFQFYAKTRDESGAVIETVVSDGKTTRISSLGKVSEHPTFVDSGAMPLSSEADSYAARMREILLRPEYLKEALTSQQILLVGQSEIEGEPCHIVLYTRQRAADFLSTQYIWVSAKTGLPRATQAMNIVRGHTVLTNRAIFSKIQLNPAIPAETFAYRPATADSSADSAYGKAMEKMAATAKDKVNKADASARGKQLPDLEVRDVENKALKLSGFNGKPTIITFWASWCGPCVGEMPVLQKVVESYQGRLQVLAIAVQEERRASLQFITEHPQYKFTFLTDPQAGEAGTPLLSFFEIQGIPVGLFVGSEGKIVDRWTGFKDEKEFVERIRKLMEQAGGSK